MRPESSSNRGAYFCLLVLLSTLISSMNVSNDFEANFNLDFAGVLDDVSVFFRGGGFFYIISLVGRVINTKYLVFALYSFVPAIQYLIFRRLISFNVGMCTTMYMGLIFFGQSTYLLKMVVAQIILMLALSVSGSARWVFLPACVLFHAQAAVVFFGYSKFVPRIIFVSLVGFLFFHYQSELVDALSAVEFTSAYGALNDNSDNGLKKVSLALVLLYILASFGDKDKSFDNIHILERIIDASVVLAFAISTNQVVANRVLDFSWLLILIYVGRVRRVALVGLGGSLVASILFFGWGVKFVFDSIIS
jgi:hypothetical protein